MNRPGIHPAGGHWYADDVPLAELAEAVGTPTYVYSRQRMLERYRQLTDAFNGWPTSICYAVKANSNLAVLNTFATAGAGFDIVSGGELVRVLEAGGQARHVVFSGLGKTIEEIDFALKQGIRCFNVESGDELARIGWRAEVLGLRAPVSLRVNPDVDPGTHPYISTGLKQNKFGVPISEARALYRQAAANKNLNVVGVDCHIGSQITSQGPLLEAVASVLALVMALREDGIQLDHVDMGGGLGVRYHDEDELDLTSFAGDVLEQFRAAGVDCELVLEPGRFLVADAGCLLTRVEYLKPAPAPDSPSFAVVDAAMNDLLRPALYQAWHQVERVQAAGEGVAGIWDVVGPVCESGDFLAKGRPMTLAAGDLLAVLTTGAYGMVQASNYNSRDRAAEVLVDGERFALVRRRETIRDQLLPETAEFINVRSSLPVAERAS